MSWRGKLAKNRDKGRALVQNVINFIYISRIKGISSLAEKLLASQEEVIRIVESNTLFIVKITHI